MQIHVSIASKRTLVLLFALLVACAIALVMASRMRSSDSGHEGDAVAPTSAPASRPSTSPTATTRIAPLRVMSFNVRYAAADDGANNWPRRRELLIRTIRAFDPDLLGTQEVLYPQPAQMRAALSDYGFAGVGREDGNAKGEYSAIFYRADRFDEFASGTFWLSPTPDVIASKGWDAALPRIATWVRLRDRAGGGELFFLNAHFDHVGKVARVRSAELIRSRLAELSGGAPIIVTGDFNTSEDDPPYKMMTTGIDSLARAATLPAFVPATRDIAPLRLFDAYRETHPARDANEATFHAFTGKTRGSRIDFILHDASFRATEASIDRTSDGERFPSDHFAVTAVVEHAH